MVLVLSCLRDYSVYSFNAVSGLLSSCHSILVTEPWARNSRQRRYRLQKRQEPPQHRLCFDFVFLVIVELSLGLNMPFRLQNLRDMQPCILYTRWFRRLCKCTRLYLDTILDGDLQCSQAPTRQCSADRPSIYHLPGSFQNWTSYIKAQLPGPQLTPFLNRVTPKDCLLLLDWPRSRWLLNSWKRSFQVGPASGRGAPCFAVACFGLGLAVTEGELSPALSSG